MGAHVDTDARAKRNVTVLVAAQAILGSQITMVFVIGGLVGQQMSPHPCFVTLPITMIVFGSMTTAPWMSAIMQRQGRRAGFLAGALGGLGGSALAVWAIQAQSFGLLLLGSWMTGMYMSAQGFYRFAATDTASAAYRPKAISYVLAGGLIAAVIGPQLVSVLTSNNAIATVDRYLPVYYAAMVINAVGMALFYLLDIPRPTVEERAAVGGRSRTALLRSPGIAVAVICAAVSYALMNLVMTSTPLAVVGCGFAVADAANVVSAHVLAMFAPSFFTGHLIVRFGAKPIVAIGLAILGMAGLVGLAGVTLPHFFGALILLGIGWNFGFVGATALLADLHTPEERGRVQGMNDAIVFGCVTLASLSSGGLMSCLGGDAAQGWAAVNIAMIPLLALAAVALVWLARQPRVSPT
ncbi:MAG: MFS transporter [Pseudomonadota bacterium]